MLLGGVVVAVLLLVVLTYVADVGFWGWSDRLCKRGEFRCALGTSVIGTALAATVAYYIVFLRREVRAGAHWRKSARSAPEDLIEWLPTTAGLTGLATKSPSEAREFTPWSRAARLFGHLFGRTSSAFVESTVGRERLVAEIAGELNDGSEPQILVGNSGSGKTTVQVELAQYLARRGQLPVPVTLTDRTSSTDFAELGRRAYVRRAKARDEEEANKQWNWFRQRQLITILVDDFDKTDLSMPERVAALRGASRNQLRLVIATRPSGLPHGPDQGKPLARRIDLPPLDESEVADDLIARLPPNGRDETFRVKALVDEAGMASTPYFLALARVLANVGELTNVEPSGSARVSLLDAYRQALIDGKVMPGDGLHSATREAVFDRLEGIAYLRLFGEAIDEELAAKVRESAAGHGGVMLFDSPVDLAKRMGVLEGRHEHEVWFAHPTTMAYFASRFLRRHTHVDSYWAIVEDPRVELTALRTLCLVLATSGVSEEDSWQRVMRTVIGLHARMPEDTEAKDLERLTICEAEAEIVASQLERVDRDRNVATDDARRRLVDLVASDAKAVGTLGGRFTLQKQILLGALARLGAYEPLWQHATGTDQEYAVRREAALQLVKMESALDVVGPKIDAVIAKAWRFSHEHGISLDDKGVVFDEFRAIAWMVPALCTVADRLDHDVSYSPEALLRLARQLTVQLGLESSIAQGIKFDAMVFPDAPVSELAMKMLTSEDESYRAQFWFSRILLLQAVTRRSIETNCDASTHDRVKEVINQSAVLGTEHPFVRETARLCGRALRTDRWREFIWTDMMEVAAGAVDQVCLEATQLIADIVIALNLNAGRSATERDDFARATRLPYCLTSGVDRKRLVAQYPPTGRCPFASSENPAAEQDGAGAVLARCLCPYLYEPPEDELKERRELSRRFCRHQRINARPLRWHTEIGTDALREFWTEMENRARF